MSDQLCCFCLGGSLDVPPFGDMNDARDFVSPCRTCLLTAHRKCLLEWFNASRIVKVKYTDSVVNTDSPSVDIEVTTGSPSDIETNIHQNEANVHPNDIDTNVDPSDNSQQNDSETNILQNDNIHAIDDSRLQTDSDPNNAIANLAVQFEFNGMRSWFSSLLPPSLSLVPPELRASDIVMLNCPQCKRQILFSSKRSAFLDALSDGKVALVSALEYSTIMTGLSTIVVGAALVGIIGLASWGLSMMHYIIPGSLQLPLLSKRYSPHLGGFSSASAYAMFTRSNGLDTALERGVVDPMRVVHIPLLPIMMYKMGATSIMSCLFEGKKGGNRAQRIANEFVVLTYLSSLGNHALLRAIVRNVTRWVSTGRAVNLLKGVDFWNPLVMISLLVPARWMYDLVFRLTFNWGHFNVIKSTKPRDITNYLLEDHADMLEELNSTEATYKGIDNALMRVCNERAEARAQKLPAFLARIPILRGLYKGMYAKWMVLQKRFKYGTLIWFKLRIKSLMFWYKLKACLIHDFSSSFIADSVTLRTFLTFVWPMASAEVGRIVHYVLVTFIKTNETISNDKLVMLSNFIALILVALGKDAFDLYIAKKKGEQLNNMRIVYARKSEDSLPGAYPR